MANDIEREEMNTILDTALWKKVTIQAIELDIAKRDFLGEAIKHRFKLIENGQDYDVEISSEQERKPINAMIEKGLWKDVSIKAAQKEEKKYEFVEKALIQYLNQS